MPGIPNNDIRSIIARARRAQVTHEQKHPVQLEIPEREWASEEEAMEHWRERVTSWEETEMPGVRRDMAGVEFYSSLWL